MTGKLYWYRAMARRGALSEDELFKLGLEECGAQGEAELLGLVKSVFGEEAWVGRNVWLDQQVECDVLVITRWRIYNLNAKFYRVDFSYSQGRAYFGGHVAKSNPLAAFQSSMDRLRALVKRVGLEVPVEGLLMFMNADQLVTVDDTVAFSCVPRAQVLRTLQGLQKDSVGGYGGGGRGRGGGAGLDRDAGWRGADRFGGGPQWIANRLLTLESESKYWAPRVDDGHLARIETGLLCMDCGGKRLEVSQRSVVCPCGRYQVSKAEAVWDSLEDYCKIFHDAPLVTAADIDWFLGGQVARRAILRVLNSKLKLTAYGKYAAYVNPHYRPPYKDIRVRSSHC